MKLSIVTSCFNSAETIEKTIKSVISQDYKDIDYVLIDGGSTDGTMDIVNKYKEYFSVIVSEKDRGVADGFNKGVHRAMGEIIGIVNADDIMYPGAARKLAEVYDGKTDIYYGDRIVVDKENKTRCYHKADPLKKIDYYLPFCHQSAYITKACYEKYGDYSMDYKLCLDYELILKMYKGGATFKYVPFPLCEYNYGGCTYVDPIATNNENIAISKKYGLPGYKAFGWKVHYLSLCYGKRALSRVGLLKTAQDIRQKLNKSIDYKTEW